MTALMPLVAHTKMRRRRAAQLQCADASSSAMGERLNRMHAQPSRMFTPSATGEGVGPQEYVLVKMRVYDECLVGELSG